MIPVPTSALISFDIGKEPDRKYAELLKRQASYINKHKSDVFDRASRTYYLATTKNKDSFFLKVCCDFKKLESVCGRYNPNFSPKRTGNSPKYKQSPGAESCTGQTVSYFYSSVPLLQAP